MRGSIAALVMVSFLGCDTFPQDPRRTLEGAIGDTLHVGVTAAPPWVATSGDDPGGVEPELIRGFAQSIGATIVWHRGSAQESMEALTHLELDLAIGGYTLGSPWRRHVGFTAPYYVSVIRVGAPDGDPPVTKETLEHLAVGVRPGISTAAYVRSHDARVIATEDLGDFPGPVAAPSWQLRALGRDTSGVELKRYRHVIAAPQGENALLMALEDYVASVDLESLLHGGRNLVP